MIYVWSVESMKTVQPTLLKCKVFDRQREDLSAGIGSEINHEVIIIAMTESEAAKHAVINFCESVISIKKERKCESEKTDPDRKARKIKRTKAKRDRALAIKPG